MSPPPTTIHIKIEKKPMMDKHHQEEKEVEDEVILIKEENKKKKITKVKEEVLPVVENKDENKNLQELTTKEKLKRPPAKKQESSATKHKIKSAGAKKKRHQKCSCGSCSLLYQLCVEIQDACNSDFKSSHYQIGHRNGRYRAAFYKIVSQKSEGLFAFNSAPNCVIEFARELFPK
jgi:outer membrane biosynthesis protein TonB